MEENVLREPAAKSALVSFLEQLKEPLMLILLAATGISFFSEKQETDSLF